MSYRIATLSRWSIAAIAATFFLPRPAAADITLVEKDDWQVFMNGRIQTFLNHNEGQGKPVPSSVVDANGNDTELRGGGIENLEGAIPEYKTGAATADDQGLVREMRLRSGFTGNVLGFGIRKRVSEDTELLGYTAVTVGVDSEARRKFNIVRPDWRESFVRLSSTWGSLTIGRTLTLFSRGATEITYLYGYRYGLGFPGVISNFSQSTAGSVGFGVMGNGFGAGLIYATPVLGGFQLSAGIYDANTLPTTPFLNRARWPRGEAEATFERGQPGRYFKLFVNGAYQQLYDYGGLPIRTDTYGTGFGGRVELGPVRLGVAGHWGRGIGITFSFEPSTSQYYIDALRGALQNPDSSCAMGNFSDCPKIGMRTITGYYGQAEVSVTKKLDLRGGVGATNVHQLPEDKVDVRDNNMMPGDDDFDDSTKMDPNLPDSVGYVTVRQQLGIGAGLTYHMDTNFHLTLEYFRAFFDWYKPRPAAEGQKFPSQVMNSINAGFTYDF